MKYNDFVHMLIYSCYAELQLVFDVQQSLGDFSY